MFIKTEEQYKNLSTEQKAALIIEAIAENNCDDDELMLTIYKCIHVMNNICKNKHEDWRKEIEQLFDVHFLTQSKEQNETITNNRKEN